MRHWLLIVLVLFLFSGCGTTTLMVTDPEAEIYVNQVYKGKGDARVPRMGPPKTLHVEARLHGRLAGEEAVKRKFDFVTFLAGYFTYGTGFIWGWRFPETVVITTEKNPRTSSFNNTESRWNQPPKNWK